MCLCILVEYGDVENKRQMCHQLMLHKGWLILHTRFKTHNSLVWCKLVFDIAVTFWCGKETDGQEFCQKPIFVLVS